MGFLWESNFLFHASAILGCISLNIQQKIKMHHSGAQKIQAIMGEVLNEPNCQLKHYYFFSVSSVSGEDEDTTGNRQTRAALMEAYAV